MYDIYEASISTVKLSLARLIPIRKSLWREPSYGLNGTFQTMSPRGQPSSSIQEGGRKWKIKKER